MASIFPVVSIGTTAANLSLFPIPLDQAGRETCILANAYTVHRLTSSQPSAQMEGDPSAYVLLHGADSFQALGQTFWNPMKPTLHTLVTPSVVPGQMTLEFPFPFPFSERFRIPTPEKILVHSGTSTFKFKKSDDGSYIRNVSKGKNPAWADDEILLHLNMPITQFIVQLLPRHRPQRQRDVTRAILTRAMQSLEVRKLGHLVSKEKNQVLAALQSAVLQPTLSPPQKILLPSAILDRIKNRMSEMNLVFGKEMSWWTPLDLAVEDWPLTWFKLPDERISQLHEAGIRFVRDLPPKEELAKRGVTFQAAGIIRRAIAEARDQIRFE
ncbi:MAG: hypothetical protein HY540_00175 [Deltaproteobacteria bacterium]|nr:hypothetical protein [Deltaproteobacteria bacterium]